MRVQFFGGGPANGTCEAVVSYDSCTAPWIRNISTSEFNEGWPAALATPGTLPSMNTAAVCNLLQFDRLPV